MVAHGCLRMDGGKGLGSINLELMLEIVPAEDSSAFVTDLVFKVSHRPALFPWYFSICCSIFSLH